MVHLYVSQVIVHLHHLINAPADTASGSSISVQLDSRPFGSQTSKSVSLAFSAPFFFFFLILPFSKLN
jgi:hypothetical protein